MITQRNSIHVNGIRLRFILLCSLFWSSFFTSEISAQLPEINFEQAVYQVQDNSTIRLTIVVDSTYIFVDSSIYINIANISTNIDHFYFFENDDLIITDYKTTVDLPVGSNSIFRSDLLYKFQITLLGANAVQYGTIRETKVWVNYLPPSQTLQLRDLIFRGFFIGDDGTSSLTLTNTIPIKKGTSFTLVNGAFNQNAGGFWNNDSEQMPGIGTFTYTGDPDLEAGTNFCIFFNDDGTITTVIAGGGSGPGDNTTLGGFVSIDINGQNADDQFMVSGNLPSSNFNLSDNLSNSVYIVQGAIKVDGPEIKLSGTFIDGLIIGMSATEFDELGAAPGLGTEFGPVSPAPGSFYGLIVCDGNIYLCDLLELVTNSANWNITSSAGVSVENNIDLQALCDDLCGIITPGGCDSMEISITISNCKITVPDRLPCPGVSHYQWEQYNTTTNSWVIVAQGYVDQLTDVPKYTATEHKMYRLVVDCEDGCQLISNAVDGLGCGGPCQAVANLISQDCPLEVIMSYCTNPSYQWQEYTTGIGYVDIVGETSSSYIPDNGGKYRVIVNCYGCDPIHIYFEFESVKIRPKHLYEERCNYCFCWPEGTTITNMVFEVDGDIVNLNTVSPFFNFPYCNQCSGNIPTPDDLVEDFGDGSNITGWLPFINDPGKATNWVIGCHKEEARFCILNTKTKLLAIESAPPIDEISETCHYVINPNKKELYVDGECDDATYLWSNGETTETITVDINSGSYSVTVDCGSGCVFVDSYNTNGIGSLQANSDIEEDNNNQHKNVDEVLGQETLQNKIKPISFYPNPTNDWVSTDINVTDEAAYRFEFFNLLGYICMTKTEQLVIGQHHLKWNIGHLVPGLYLVKTIHNGHEQLTKLIITEYD